MKVNGQIKQRFAITGGAGFIGSHFTAELLNNGHSVLVIDNLCSGTKEHLKPFLTNNNFSFELMNVEDTEKLAHLLNKIDTVIHLASNPDIARSVSEPRIDFTQGTALTESVAEAAGVQMSKTSYMPLAVEFMVMLAMLHYLKLRS